MRKILLAAVAATGLAFATAPASAEGELLIYNWTDYTAPDLIEKFEKETGINVTLDTYDSNETLLAKLKSGAGGYDIIVPTHNIVPILIEEGLIQEINAADLPGYDNIDDRWKSPAWDQGNAYTIPWQWGTTSFTVDTAVYKGDIDTFEVLFNPPKELQGKIGMFKAPEEVIAMAQIYLGLPLCNENPKDMAKVLEVLEGQKPHVKVYNSDGILERLVSGDTAIHSNWNGYSMRARKERPSLQYAYPKEGVTTWFDNIAVPAGAKNADSAIKFVTFMLDPENAAIQSNFAGYSNGIAGSKAFMKDELKDAPEINAPSGVKTIFVETCSQKAIELSDRVWTKLLQ